MNLLTDKKDKDMKISQIAAKPKLIQLSVDDEDIVKEFGEPVEFWTWDRQPIDVFMKMANANGQDPANMIEVVRTLILDEEGKQVIRDGMMIPNKLLVSVISKVVETLGK